MILREDVFCFFCGRVGSLFATAGEEEESGLRLPLAVGDDKEAVGTGDDDDDEVD